MNSLGKLLLYVVALVAVFGLAFVAGKSLVPEETVATWTREANEGSEQHAGMGDDPGHGDHGDTRSSDRELAGLSLEQDGYRLSPVSAPDQPDVPGEMSFRIDAPDGEPLTRYTRLHERDLHLVVVRQDGDRYVHAHPTLDTSTGVWTIPWEWKEAGTYRVFVDFQPDSPDAKDNLTLARNFSVSGPYRPSARLASRTDTVDGFDMELMGSLEAGQTRTLTADVKQAGSPDLELEPYLGSTGHLVVLREGDLAYLHAHPAEEPSSGDEDHGETHQHAGSHSAGNQVSFEVMAPTPGRYLLYLDFKVNGVVRTAEFVMEATR